jgi:hypothetical protein
MEEIAFWRSEDSANPDKEIVAAVKPSLATIPDSVLIGISTPYSRRGLLFEMWKRHFGKTGGPLIWKAKTEIMNPTINKEIIKQDFIDDPQAALSEWGAEWRSDIEALIPLEAVEEATIPNRFELHKNGDEGFKYYAFADPSGGRQDSFTLGIAHREQREGSDFAVLVLDSLLEQRPPFKPEDVVSRFAEHLQGYDLNEIVMDRYSGEWAKNSFERNGIMVKESELSKSEIYLEFLPLISNGRVELLDNKKLAVQLSSLERKTRAGGKDLVDVFFGHDDMANSACGALLRAEREGGKASLADAIEWV